MYSNSKSSLVSRLLNPTSYPHPTEVPKLLETHISWVFLAGAYAYKIKKPVNFGFLDFSTLDKRHFYCLEELRLNRRLAQALYLDVVAIGGSPDAPVFGAEPVFEYAVRMKRFETDATFDVLLAQQRLSPDLIDQLAVTIADFHAGLPETTDDYYGQPESVWAPILENFDHLKSLSAVGQAGELELLQKQSAAEFQRCRDYLVQRRRLGMIRECHGDLHLGNIVLLDGRPTPFDGIEFNPALRWIDVISDIAFLIMDLQHRGRADLGYRFLNAYLQRSGDYAGIAVLRFYLAYRAMVRAKVCALRAAQGETSAGDESSNYLTLTGQFLNKRQPALIITHGLPGCGKTVLSQIVIETFAAIRLRSDVERKRLFGLQATASSQGSGIDIYTPQATEQTYQHLLTLSRLILQSGFPLIVDAAFLKQRERQQFRDLATELKVPFVILSIQVDDDLARQRLRQRQQERNDASEADTAVYQLLQQVSEPLIDEERSLTLNISNNGSLEQMQNDSNSWARMKKLLWAE